jgi:iron complex outermembrane recepter protein
MIFRLSSVVASALLLMNAVSVFAEEKAPQDFDIGAQSLVTALSEFARQSQQQLLFAPEVVAEKKTQGVKGTLAPSTALAALLRDTGLTFTTTMNGAILIGEPRAVAGEDRGLRVAQAEAQGSDSNAGASSASADLEEVVVTAQKRIERLQDVPVPVSTISGQTLVNRNLLRLEDYYHKIPGVSFTVAGNGWEPRIIIRGMSSSVIDNPTVATVVDDVPYGRSRSLGGNVSVPDIDPGDVEQVEVLRGPQGTLYGASSIGGLLKYVTVNPSTERLSGRLQVGTTRARFGDDFGHSVRGSINVPVNDMLAVRVSGFTLSDPGYIDNPQTGERDANSRDSEGGRVSALWQPNEKFSLKLAALVQETKRFGSPLADLSLGEDPKFNQLPGTGFYDRESRAAGATMTGHLGAVELVSATGYSFDKFNSNMDFTPFFGGTLLASGEGGFQTEKFTQELRATIPLTERLSWLAGVFYTKEKDQNTPGGGVYLNDSTGAKTGLLARNILVPGTFYEERSVFSNLTVDLTERFDVQFGGRYSENEQSTIRATVTAIDAAPTFAPPEGAEDNSFTYLVTPRYRISSDLMVYARLASGYRPGGPNINCGQDGVPCEYEPDTSKNYEIGAKGEILNGKLSFDTSIYRIDWENLQFGPIGLFPNDFVTNASQARSQGVELSLESKPLTGLTLSGWVAYNDAELTEPMDFNNGSPPLPAGSRLPFSTPWTAGASVDQEFPLPMWSGADAFVGIDSSYVGARSIGIGRSPSRPSFVMIDLRTGIEFGTWEVNLAVNNVADKRAVVANGFAPGHVIYHQPRTAVLSVSKEF